ncbi:putative metallopeptidase [Phycisphaerales bacterium AB-hyl4]|uniref:Metallopeptidase n=1 Tax=Natronomicrosphaera hydrolytica TaxID=3242702 RepID=A0ABV4U5U6_9BACT
MPIGYDKGGPEVTRIVQEVMHAHHPCLVHAGVRVGTLMARWSSDTEAEPQPAVKWGGYPAAAVVKVLPLKQRVLGNPDALITFDERVWEDLDATEQRALVDHELEHLQVLSATGGVCYYDDVAEAVLGSPKGDDVGRPKLTCKLHDWQLGGFRSIAKRYGESALDVQAVRACKDAQSGQYYWDFFDERGRDAEHKPPRSASSSGGSRSRRTMTIAEADAADDDDASGGGTQTIEIEVYVSPEERKARAETQKLCQRIAADKLTGKEDVRTLRLLHDLIPDGKDATLTLGGGTDYEATLDAACKQRLADVLKARGEEGGDRDG